MKALVEKWRRSPAVRFVSRAVVTAVGAYVADSIKNGHALSLTALAIAAGTAGIYAAIGLLTPVEPHVGPAKTKVHVPPEPGLVPKQP